MESSANSPHVLEHLDWVRDLARSLVSDASQADDLSQEAWLAARRNSLPSGVSLRRWLAAVVRNLALETRRGEGRRRDREALSPVRESATAADLVLERAAVHRRVVEHVMELEDPYRTAILLRYFDGSKPHEIARRLGVSTATVKTRLRRAHELLRARLAREGEDDAWLGALMLLVAPGTENAGTLAAGTMGGIVMSTKFVAMSSVGLCALGAWWALSNPTPDTPPTIAEGAPHGTASSPSTTVTLDAAVATRSEHRQPAGDVSDPAATATSVAPVPEERRLEVLAIDVAGAPVANLELRFLSEGHEDLRGTTDGRGMLSIAHPDRHGRIVASSDVYVTLLESHAHATGASEVLAVVVAPACELAGEVVDERGSPIANVVLEFGVYANLRDRLEELLVHLPGVPATRASACAWSAQLSSVRGLDGSAFGQWKTGSDASGQFSLPRAPCLDASFLRVRSAGFAALDVALAGRSDARMRIVLERPGDGARVLLGRVVDSHGAPVAGARVALGRTGAATDERGEFQLALDALHAPPDDVHHRSLHASRGCSTEGGVLFALAPGFLPARLERDLVADPDDGWPDFAELVLAGAPFSIRGRVVNALGLPVPSAHVGVVDRTLFGIVVEENADSATGTLGFVEDLLAGVDGANQVVADASGRFAIGGLEPRDYRLWAVDPTMAVALSEPIAAGSEGVEIELHGRAIPVRGRVTRPSGEPMASVRVTPMRELEPPSNSLPGLRGPLVYAETSVETGPDGRFAFDALAIDGVELMAWAGPDYGSVRRSLAGYGAEEELEIVVAAICHFYVELAPAIDADACWMEDAEGRKLDLMQRSGNFRFAVSEASLFGGRSGVYAVEETARTLVVVSDGREVLRVPIELEVGVVTPLSL